MAYRARVADKLMRRSADQLVSTAGAVITGLANNPAFPAPTVDLKALQAAADDLNAALAAQAHGGAAATAEKRNKQEVLIALRHELNSAGQVATLISYFVSPNQKTGPRFRDQSPCVRSRFYRRERSHENGIVELMSVCSRSVIANSR